MKVTEEMTQHCLSWREARQVQRGSLCRLKKITQTNRGFMPFLEVNKLPQYPGDFCYFHVILNANKQNFTSAKQLKKTTTPGTLYQPESDTAKGC